MTDHTHIKTHADGSIDTAHYMARGRALRSTAALEALRKLGRPVRIALGGAARREPKQPLSATDPVRV